MVALVLLPVFVIPARLLGRRLQALHPRAMQLNAELSIDDDRAVQRGRAPCWSSCSAAREQENAAVRRPGRPGPRHRRDHRHVRSVFFIALSLLASLATAVVYGLGGAMVIHGALQIGTLVALTALLARLYGPLTALSNVRVDVMTALVSFDRVFEVLDLQPLIEEKPGAVPLRRPSPGRGRPAVAATGIP